MAKFAVLTLALLSSNLGLTESAEINKYFDRSDDIKHENIADDDIFLKPMIHGLSHANNPLEGLISSLTAPLAVVTIMSLSEDFKLKTKGNQAWPAKEAWLESNVAIGHNNRVTSYDLLNK